VNPTTLKTAVNAGNEQGDAASSPQFLMFNPTVVEQGNRELWNLHAAYFYKGLSLLAEWDSGYTTYGRLDNGSRTPVPVSGYYVQGAYILTGETLEKRVVIDPIHPFDIRRGKYGLGAWEVHGRFSQLNVGHEVFTAGLSDPNLWSNNAWAVDTGLNWYINRYFKVYLDWQHAEFGSPVFINVGRWQKTSDLFWIRCQFYF
jgi:phosphate-selective porin OprO/OprP